MNCSYELSSVLENNESAWEEFESGATSTPLAVGEELASKVADGHFSMYLWSNLVCIYMYINISYPYHEY